MSEKRGKRWINIFSLETWWLSARTVDGLLSFAIYVRSVQKQQQFYTERGKWRIAHSKDLDYVVKQFAPRELVAPLLPHFPDKLAQLSFEMQSSIEGGVPRPIGAPLLQSMIDFDTKLQEFYRDHAQTLDNIHETVADEEDRLAYTLEELACKALGKDKEELDETILFAVHQAVRRKPFLIENDRSSLFTNHYLVQPKRVAKVLDQVVQWTHEHQDHLLRAATGRVSGRDVPKITDHPMQRFLQKAQRLIALSRRARSPTTMASVGPTAQRYEPGQDGKPMVYREMPTEPFNDNDRKIIEYLLLWCIPPRRMTSGSLRSTGSYIMRATGMYTTLDLNASTVQLFLQELGVIAPWENLRLLDQSLALPGHGISKKSDAMWQNVQEACEKLNKEGLSDSMESLRTDWGDLAVYCVDNPDAQEIDDGVSLERVPGSTDTFWIRIHIANPSAFVNRDSTIMEYAAMRNQTLYVPERTYPMLPSSLTQSHFSLAPGRPTLTFSAKINLQGEVLETEIANGIARNVIYITHDKLRSLFEPSTDSPEVLAVGGQFTKEHSREGMRSTLTPEDQDTFHTLRKLMLAFREYRLKNGAMELPSRPDTSVSVIPGTESMRPFNMDVTNGHYFLGDPIIQLRSGNTNPHEVPDVTKRNLISTLMNFACWVSGKWCAERNIPAVYDGTWYHPEYPRLTNENAAGYGGQGWLHYAAPKGISSSTPVPHIPLGLDTYVKSTSPLRRYIDLIAHYQIEAALRFEHEHSRQLDATQDTAVLPFSQADVDEYISRSRWKSNRIRDCDTASKQFWACMLLFRAFYFGECDLPETFTCLVHKPYNSTPMAGTEFGQGYSGVITSLGVRCQILAPNMPDIDILSIVTARITSVDLSRMIVVVEATQVLKHFERVGEWR
ncbi:exoribonuclease II [Aspergillus clavatus NRRL 1]|uniref:Mitochondrial exoribonuclease Cyt-4, putative n=1 Tax=Aspergillus clavatus (strain ATCC 1007 / CBS 513.65 / DSM 816 / NCTC 3887 / NRRL 1 / QM 1276 / 107) TaxID=344612 RepID=A1CG86_ASPCL|nr:mitochondrial exoribonuclease Cyt-4, putative [Aspergillus clavatus NRRL 1]EAW10966.1 mitochondrial exoribonuclease Cyt-4, putative [Aspergillus clavatus NRRL 1]